MRVNFSHATYEEVRISVHLLFTILKKFAICTYICMMAMVHLDRLNYE